MIKYSHTLILLSRAFRDTTLSYGLEWENIESFIHPHEIPSHAFLFPRAFSSDNIFGDSDR